MATGRNKIILLSISFSMISCLLLIFELAGYSYFYPLRFGNKFSIITKNSSISLSSLSPSSLPPLALSRESSKGPCSTARTKTIEEESNGNLSILGSWLRAPEGTPPPSTNSNSTFAGERLLILVWKHGFLLERRHVRHLPRNNDSDSSAWQGCSASNCLLSYRDEDLSKADAVIFHLHRTRGIEEIPTAKGKLGQIWIFMTDESPLNTFLYAADKQDITVYDNIFDWSMSYREDSDIPVPYGRTVARRNIREEKRGRNGKGRDKLVAIVGSNCSPSENQRWRYVEKLKASLGERLDVYGRCLGGNTSACPGHFYQDCAILAGYKFYLAFENSNCREYITEKVYWNAYEKGSVPIIMGAPRIDCERLLPPCSFVHVDDFEAPQNLADYLLYLDNNDEAYQSYHQWRSSYIVVNEHGYFGSVSKHYCRVCEALRYNVPPSTIPKYRRIGDYLNSDRDCYPHRAKPER